ncbi:DUF3108 domain-containing protein [Hydrogenophaga sp. XSHU_21]
MTARRTGPPLSVLALLTAGVLAAHAGLLGAAQGTGATRHAPADPLPPRAAEKPLPETTLAATPPVLVTGVRITPTVAERQAPARAPAAHPGPVPAQAEATPGAEPAPTAGDRVAQATPPRTMGTPPPADGKALAPAPPSLPPPSARLQYEVFGQAKGFDYRADGVLDWRLDGQAYEARLELSMPLLGKRVQTSRGSVGPDGLRPDRFADQRRSERATHFERTASRIRFSNNAPEAELMPGAQDRLSLFLQLGGLVRAQARAAGDVITFQVAGVGDAEVWQFEVGELETLRLPAGEVQARAFKRTPRKPHDSTVEVWLAPAMNHLPVRLRVTQANGDLADQRLSALP